MIKSGIISIIKWIARIIALFVIIAGLPFYLGYGNPLPFIKQEYTVYDNTWLTIFPIIFISLALGWKYEKLAGYLLVISLSIGYMISMISGEAPGIHLTLPLIVGILYLIVGYNTRK